MYQLLSLFMTPLSRYSYLDFQPLALWLPEWLEPCHHDENTTHGIQHNCCNIIASSQRVSTETMETIWNDGFMWEFILDDICILYSRMIRSVTYCSTQKYNRLFECRGCVLPNSMGNEISSFCLLKDSTWQLCCLMEFPGISHKTSFNSVTEVAPQIQAQRPRTFCLLGRPQVKWHHLKIKRASCKWASEWIQCSSIKSFRIGLRSM